MQQRHRELRPKRAITCGKQQNNHQDLQADHRAGDCKAFHCTAENKCQDIVEVSAPNEIKEETTNNRLRAMDLRALTTLGTVALTDR
jgi:hypothetical protein